MLAKSRMARVAAGRWTYFRDLDRDQVIRIGHGASGSRSGIAEEALVLKPWYQYSTYMRLANAGITKPISRPSPGTGKTGSVPCSLQNQDEEEHRTRGTEGTGLAFAGAPDGDLVPAPAKDGRSSPRDACGPGPAFGLRNAAQKEPRITTQPGRRIASSSGLVKPQVSMGTSAEDKVLQPGRGYRTAK